MERQGKAGTILTAIGFTQSNKNERQEGSVLPKIYCPYLETREETKISQSHHSPTARKRLEKAY